MISAWLSSANNGQTDKEEKKREKEQIIQTIFSACKLHQQDTMLMFENVELLVNVTRKKIEFVLFFQYGLVNSKSM